MEVPLGIAHYVRNRADLSGYPLVNRFFEENPGDQVKQTALIERPALVEYLEHGDGPGRRLYTQPGFCNSDLFHVSGEDLYAAHMEANRTVTSRQIAGTIQGEGTPDMAATDTYLWITDGYELQYTDGTAALTSITTPDDDPMISLDVFNGYILCVRNNSDRFYWIEPNATTIDPLNFATAERAPDRVWQVRTWGDVFFLFGEKTTEVWRATGNGDAPFMRIQGRLFEQGIWGGTSLVTKDGVFVIGADGTVYDISGAPRPISNPAIAEAMRDAIKAQREAI